MRIRIAFAVPCRQMQAVKCFVIKQHLFRERRTVVTASSSKDMGWNFLNRK